MKKLKKCRTTHKKRSDTFEKNMERIKKIWNT